MLKYLLNYLCIFLISFLLSAPTEAAPQKLRLILDWFPNPDHAPLFVAEEQGYFKAENLELELLSPADPNDPPKLLAAGKADLALTYEPDFIDQVEQGLKLIAIGTLIDRPLNCLLVPEDSSIHNLSDLKNKRIAVTSGGVTVLILEQMLKTGGLTLQDITLINTHYNGLQALLTKRVDALTGVMRNMEVPALEQQGKKARLFLPEKTGLPTYAELIFITHASLLEEPDKKQALLGFLRAIHKAQRYLKAHPEESFQAFAKQNPAFNNEFNHRAWFKTLPYFSTEPARLSKEEWRAFLKFMRQNHFIRSNRALTDYLADLKTTGKTP